MKTNQLALNTVSVRGGLREILDGAARAGFRNVEFQLGQVEAFLRENSLAELLQLLRDHELTVVGGFHGGLEVYSGNWAANRARHVEMAKLLADLGQGVTQNMVVGTDARPIGELENPLERFAEALGELAGDLAPLGVNVLIEFNWGAVKTLALAADIARASGAANAGVLFDPAHYYCTPTKFADLTPGNVAAIKHVHVDNMRRKPAELSNCNSDRLLPGDPAGVMDLPGLFGRLEEHGYAGLFSIEMFSDASRRMYQSLLTLVES